MVNARNNARAREVSPDGERDTKRHTQTLLRSPAKCKPAGESQTPVLHLMVPAGPRPPEGGLRAERVIPQRRGLGRGGARLRLATVHNLRVEPPIAANAIVPVTSLRKVQAVAEHVSLVPDGPSSLPRCVVLAAIREGQCSPLGSGTRHNGA